MLQTLLFFHILGVVGLFVGIVLELLVFVHLRRAKTLADVRAATLHVPAIAPVIGPSVLLILVMGIALIYVSGFGWSQGWIDAVLVVVVAFAIAAPILVGRKLDALHTLAKASGDGPITPSIERTGRDAVATYMCFFGLLAVITALYVMVSKPALPEVIALLVLAAVVAVFVTAMLSRGATSAPAFVSSSVSQEEKPTTVG